jgi:hypothetical protein
LMTTRMVALRARQRRRRPSRGVTSSSDSCFARREVPGASVEVGDWHTCVVSKTIPRPRKKEEKQRESCCISPECTSTPRRAGRGSVAMPDGPRLGDYKGGGHMNATKLWAVKALGDLPRTEWAPPKRGPRRFNVALTLEGSVHLDIETHGEVPEQLKPPRMRRAGVPFEVRSAANAQTSETRETRVARLPIAHPFPNRARSR